MSIEEAYHRVRLRLENWRSPEGACLSPWEVDNIMADVVACGHAVNEQYAHTLAVKVVYGSTKARLDALIAPAAEGGQEEK